MYWLITFLKFHSFFNKNLKNVRLKHAQNLREAKERRITFALPLDTSRCHGSSLSPLMFDDETTPVVLYMYNFIFKSFALYLLSYCLLGGQDICAYDWFA